MSTNSDNISDTIKRTFEDIRGMSALQQTLVGGTAGLATGYILSRVGKLAAFVLGSGVIALQVAQHMGYIEVRWTKKSKIDDLKKKAIKAAEEAGVIQSQSKMEKLALDTKKFFKNNVTFAVSFGGGLLIGFSF